MKIDHWDKKNITLMNIHQRYENQSLLGKSIIVIKNVAVMKIITVM